MAASESNADKRRVVISGASGLVGSHLGPHLERDGWRVDALVRRPPKPGSTEVRWDPAGGMIDVAGLEGVDVVVHLAGENIAGGRWNEARKAAIRNSRVDGTRLIARTLAGLEQRPSVFVCASAVGYYGDRGDEELTEESAAGKGFLAEVCRDWEAACEPARKAGIRVVNVRIAMVLSSEGGALPKMLTPFKAGLGGKLGSGEQYMSWISLTDLKRVLKFAIEEEELVGPVNAAAPQPVRNMEFTKTLGEVLGRPTKMTVPKTALRMMVGEMADEMLLVSERVIPARLREAGFTFEHPGLAEALGSALR